jgi:hypothetical protein
MLAALPTVERGGAQVDEVSAARLPGLAELNPPTNVDEIRTLEQIAPRPGSQVFIIDLMEPEQPQIGREITEILKAEKLLPGDFVIKDDGIVRLNPQLARHVIWLTARQRCVRYMAELMQKSLGEADEPPEARQLTGDGIARALSGAASLIWIGLVLYLVRLLRPFLPELVHRLSRVEGWGMKFALSGGEQAMSAAFEIAAKNPKWEVEATERDCEKALERRRRGGAPTKARKSSGWMTARPTIATNPACYVASVL